MSYFLQHFLLKREFWRNHIQAVWPHGIFMLRSISSANGLAPNWCQTLTKPKMTQFYYGHISLGHNTFTWEWYANTKVTCDSVRHRACWAMHWTSFAQSRVTYLGQRKYRLIVYEIYRDMCTWWNGVLFKVLSKLYIHFKFELKFHEKGRSRSA